MNRFETTDFYSDDNDETEEKRPRGWWRKPVRKPARKPAPTPAPTPAQTPAPTSGECKLAYYKFNCFLKYCQHQNLI